jgi:tetratricopeptide (TPR) repeat protein
VGRRLGYLGRYRKAIEIFTEGIELHPDDPRFYRHRGHRFISIRRFDAAVADLEKAASLILGKEDGIEPDGLPNEFGIPTSTHHSNIWYHLGLAHYLRGDFERARAAYQRCLAVSDNADMLAATVNWLYLTLRRLGLTAEAQELLLPITAEMKILENRDYHRLLLMYKGEIVPEALLEEVNGDHGLGSATTGYGVGTWLLVNGNKEAAREIYRDIVDGDSVTAFGFIAAEAELRRPS